MSEKKIRSTETIPCGKHKGTTFKDVVERDPKYADWVRTCKRPGKLSNFKRYLKSLTKRSSYKDFEISNSIKQWNSQFCEKKRVEKPIPMGAKIFSPNIVVEEEKELLFECVFCKEINEFIDEEYGCFCSCCGTPRT